jgi:peptide/nickel transport system substrate-binding protein
MLRRILGFVAVLAGCLPLAEPSLGQEKPQSGGSVIVGIAVEPAGLNPAITTSTPDQLIGCSIYQGLTEIGGYGEVKALLAKSWTISPDGLTYTFTLNPAKWQDGQPLTSADVKFSITEVSARLTPSFAAGAGRLIDAVETPAPDQVVIKLKQPFGPLLRSLSCITGAPILPMHIFAGTNVQSNPATTTKPIGSGPFVLAEWKRGEFIRLTKNKDYWEQGKPYLDEVIVRILPQASSRTQALMTGEIDFLPYFWLPTNDLPVIQGNPKLKLIKAKLPPAQDMLFFNTSRKTLADKRVRQALMMATDRQFILKTGWLGQGAEGIAPFVTELTWAANPDIDYRKMYPYDVAKANALLDEAGFKRGANGIRFKFDLVYVAEEVDFPRVAVAIKQMWSQVGVDVVLEGYDRPTTDKRVFLDRDFDGHLNGYTSFGDPALGLARIFIASTAGRPYGNPTGYTRPEVEELFKKGETANAESERGAAYRQVQTILADDLPVLTIHQRIQYDAMAVGLRNTEADVYLPTWRNTWVKK